MSTSNEIETLNSDSAMDHLESENPVSKTAKAAEELEKDERELGKNEGAYKDLSLWWFPFPLIAGALGPMASAFTICAIIVPWRVGIASNGFEEYRRYIDHPKWLIGIAATQLTLAIVSNLFLYLNMARRVRFSIAQPIVISGWYLSSFILISIVVVAAKPLDSASPSNYEFTQAFYYAIFSACLYFFVATIMIVTVVGYYKGHYNTEFKLTVSERTLTLQTIVFLFYLLCGAGVYAHIEGWEYLDAVYWADYTILTVGIGDIVPKTDLGRILLFPFAIGGVTILGLVVYSVRSLVLERGKSILSLRITERQRQRALKKIREQSKEKPCHTERQRFKHEFELMRRIQGNAIRRRRWLSLLVSSFVWLILWLLSAAVFRATEKAQSWTYLDSVYFAYVSLLTIGYGDFYPKSSPGRAFFVFWSLLAIPAITILISNIGETVVEEIRSLTLLIGRFTIFPGKDFEITIKRAKHNASKGRVFHNNIEETPSDILNHMKHHIQQPHSLEQESTSIKHALLSPCIPSGREAGGSKFKHLLTRKDRHCLLIREIMIVMGHADSSPGKRYTFDEWEWYLKLLGEYESNVQAEGTLLEISNPDRDGLTGATNGGGNLAKGQGIKKHVKWSWIGNRSPLTWTMEEPKWLLDKLTKTLQSELECERRGILEPRVCGLRLGHEQELDQRVEVSVVGRSKRSERQIVGKD